MATERTPVPSAPVVIGGLGGSGTRVIAEILLGLGFDLGRDLNVSLDNTLFTLLFKRPRWHAQARAEDIEQCLRLFDHLSSAQRVTPDERRALLWALRDAVLYGRGVTGQDDNVLLRVHGRTLWPLRRLLQLRPHFVARPQSRPWGFKEPNAHVYLAQLARHYAGMRYVHVIRHGLDMAYSRNQAQLLNWGGLYDRSLMLAPGAKPSAAQALDYWLLANERAIAQGRALLGSRFLLVNYDELCRTPRSGVRALCEFLGIHVDDAKLESLASIPSVPDGMGRYRGHALAGFSPDQFDRVRRLGFEIEPVAARS